MDDDGISMTLLKQPCEDVCILIVKIVNMPFQQGIVPDAIELAKIIPIYNYQVYNNYKAKSNKEFTNYHLISLRYRRRLFVSKYMPFLQNVIAFIISL